MAGNGNDHVGAAFDDMGARVGILSQRMSTVETVVGDLRNMLSAIATKLEDRNKPQWGVMISFAAFMLMFFTAIGSLSYMLISAKQDTTFTLISQKQSAVDDALAKLATAQSTTLDTLRTDYLSRAEAEQRAGRSKEDRDRFEKQFSYFQDNVFPREVHLQRWARFDSDIAAVRHDMDLQVENLERQIEQLQKAQSDTYTARDAILENKDQIRRLEEQIRSLIERKFP